MTIRDAQDGDLPAILQIFNHEVLHSTALWIETPTTLEERRDWLHARRARGFPVLVAEAEDGTVAGYGSFGDFRPYEGFRNTVEHLLYVAQSARGHGHGGALLDALITRAAAMGKRVMIAAIDAENRASIVLHERRGFEHCGVVPGVGEKFGQARDMVLMRLGILTPPASP
jgi:L-amino acid N-acyltransferase